MTWTTTCNRGACTDKSITTTRLRQRRELGRRWAHVRSQRTLSPGSGVDTCRESPLVKARVAFVARIFLHCDIQPLPDPLWCTSKVDCRPQGVLWCGVQKTGCACVAENSKEWKRVLLSDCSEAKSPFRGCKSNWKEGVVTGFRSSLSDVSLSTLEPQSYHCTITKTAD